MKIISWNVNGLRSTQKKGFLNWLKKANPDLLCLQEIKAQPSQLSFELIKPFKYSSFFHSAVKKGYSGVMIYTKKKPLTVKRKLNFEKFDQEGRFIQLNFADFTLINFYLPHGQRDKAKLPYKIKVYSQILKYLKKIKERKIILAGDFNIAHQEIDLARPKENQNNIMFTLKERNQLNQLIKMGFADSFRKFNKKAGHYTWWPYRFKARERNLGWRLDYFFVSQKLKPKLKKAFILKEIDFSDHSPIGIKIND